MGKKKQPIYKLVAADERSPRDGKFIEAVGLYNPLTNPHTLDLKEERILYWLGVGAQPTDTVKSLLRQKGIILKRELAAKGLDEEKIKSELENWQKAKEVSLKKKAEQKQAKKKKAADKPAEESAAGGSEVKSEAEEKKEGTAEV
jgi:small subunit ribosomal protein S16